MDSKDEFLYCVLYIRDFTKYDHFINYGHNRIYRQGMRGMEDVLTSRGGVLNDCTP